MNYNSFRTAIANAIDSNGVKAITGKVLQEAILSVIDALDLGAIFLGEATTTTRPSSDANGFYLALQTGTYTHFQISVAKGEVALIVKTDSRWKKQVLTVMPYIDPVSKHWIVNGEDSGVLAEGQQGQPGQNAVTPFKGWYDPDEIPTTGQEGDYCYVTDDGTTKVWKWNPDAEPPAFEETADTPDTDHTQTFASNESVNQVAIDNSHLVNPVNTADSTKPVLARAEDAQLLMKKIFQANEVDLSAIESSPNFISYSTKLWITGSNGGSHKFVQVEEGKIVTIYANSGYNTHFAFTSTTDSEVGTSPSYVTEDQLQYVTKGTVKNVIVPPLAKYMYLKDKEGINLLDYLPSSVIIRSSQDLLFSNEVVDGLDSVETKKPLSANQGRELDNKITDLPYTLSNVEPLNVDFSQLTENIIPFIIGISTKTWFAPAEPNTIYRSSYVIKISEGSKIEVTANSEHNANIAFLNGYPNPVEGEPVNLVSSNSIYSIQPGTSQSLVAPAGTKYLYVKKGDGKNNPDYSKPASLTITPIELATKEEIESFEKVVQQPVNPTLYNAIVVNAFIGISSLNWVLGDTYKSAFIPVNVGDRVHIIAPLGNLINFAFVSEYPQPQAGVAAPLVGEIYRLGTEYNPVREGSYITPEAAKFLYVKLREGNAAFTPSTLEIIPNSSSIIKSYYSEDYEDTYIEEDIFSKTPEKFNDNYTCVKWYKIDHSIKDKYKLIIKTTATNVYLSFADANKEIMTDYNVASTQTELKVLDNVVIPEGAEYILVQPYLQPSTGSTKVTKGCGALMKPLKYCNSTPKNDYIYCVSRISDVANTPNNYYSDEIYPTISDWSAWMFRLPKNTNSVEGKPNPIASFFHGQSGWVSSEQMGYNNESTNTRMVEDLVEAGFIVFDINGYGVSWQSDEKSMFWGCRMGVDTAKKAYETIVERFNGRRGFFVSGISMGGAIGKSYPMIYPNDVVACALEAPTEIGLTIRYYQGDGSQALSHISIYKAFGYASDVDMANDLNRENCIGLSPCVKPLEIDSETGMLKYIGNVMTYDRAYMKEHNDDFYAKFPVEVRVWHSPLDTTAGGGVDYQASLLFVNSLRKANCNAILRKVELPVTQTQHSLNFYPWIRQEIVEYAREKMMR